MSASSWLCYQMAKQRIRRRRPGGRGSNPATLSAEAYADWRSSELRGHFDRYFSDLDLTGCDVVDLGCGYGDLTLYLAHRRVKSIVGIDLDAQRVAVAQRRAAELEGAVRPQFITASNGQTVDLPDNSTDIVLCFDVLEHLMHYEDMFHEWRRVLRPGGRVLIMWIPWGHPYGGHIDSLVPLPWCHLLMRERNLVNVCARIYDLPDYPIKHWDTDDNGCKKPNKWRDLEALPEVNRLTIGRFERCCHRIGLHIERVVRKGFNRPWIIGGTGLLTRVPGLREVVTAHSVYELRNPS